MSLMPTWLIGIWRVSARLCTSSTETARGWEATAGFMCGPGCRPWKLPEGWGAFRRRSTPRWGYRGRLPALCSAGAAFQQRNVFPEESHGGCEAGEIQFRGSQAILARAVLDEAVRDAERER